MIRTGLVIFRKLAGIVGFILVLGIMIQCNNSTTETKKDKNQTEDKKPASKSQTKEPAKLVYDDNENIIERHNKAYQKDGSLRSMDDYYYKYDDRGNVIEEIKESHDADGVLSYKNVNFYTYDDKNQKIELRFFSYNGNEELQRKARNTYEYNDRGLCVLEHSYNNEDKLFLKIIRYQNDAGELTAEEFIHFDDNGEKKDHKKYHYSQFGLEKTEDMMKK